MAALDDRAWARLVPIVFGFTATLPPVLREELERLLMVPHGVSVVGLVVDGQGVVTVTAWPADGPYEFLRLDSRRIGLFPAGDDLVYLDVDADLGPLPFMVAE